MVGDSSGEPYPQVEPPASLVRLQAEFGRSMATPFLFVDAAGEFRVQLDQFSPELVALMVPREDAGLSGADRLATYNQQYWYRLFSVMQEEYPLLRHLAGVTQLNQLTSAYLSEYPSRSPTLRNLSNDFVAYLAGDHPWNAPVWREAAQLDYIFIQVFDAAQRPALDPAALTPEQTAALLEKPLPFQPHVFLFEEHWNLVELRRAAWNDDDDELELTPVERHGQWAIFRGHGRTIPLELTEPQYRLLGNLVAGDSLGNAVDALAATYTGADLHGIVASLQGWFAEWVSYGWFVAE